eukprot:TRINITY_DN14496_c0_g2_i2.p2 TRINITY_DN14496_c0_g2~~TRINITY_DN14496_c0_g2_i2.p2  ORF type:complete len:244 (+),score=17.62 TRINITY_DN14496_c0_g2_i2:36-767(+)
MMPQPVRAWQTKGSFEDCDACSEGSTTCGSTDSKSRQVSPWSQSTLPEFSPQVSHDANRWSELEIELPGYRPSKPIPECPKQACHDVKRLNALAIELPRRRPSKSIPDCPKQAWHDVKRSSSLPSRLPRPRPSKSIRSKQAHHDVKRLNALALEMPRRRPSKPDKSQTSRAKSEPRSEDSSIRDINKVQVLTYECKSPRTDTILSASLRGDMSLNALFPFLESGGTEDMLKRRGCMASPKGGL